jgi:LPS sulfotransferase NodH
VDQPVSGFIVVGQPRRGSARLSAGLTATGVLGRPEEYYWRGQERDWAARLGVRPPTEANYGQYLEAVMRYATTPNGVFSAKLFWGHAEDLIQRSAIIPGMSALTRSERFRAILPQPLSAVHIRRNCLRAAISLWRAERSGVWSLSPNEAPPPVPGEVDIERVSVLHDGQHSGDEGWTDLLQGLDIPTMTLSYVEIVSDLPGAIIGVASLVGQKVSASDVFPRPTDRQADSATERFLRQWVAETGGCGVCGSSDE